MSDTLAAIVGLVSLTAVASVEYTHHPGRCVHGHNIIKYTGKTVGQCTRLCELNSACMGFEYGVRSGSAIGPRQLNSSYSSTRGRHMNTLSGYQPGDCQLSNSADMSYCDGSDVDFYHKPVHCGGPLNRLAATCSGCGTTRQCGGDCVWDPDLQRPGQGKCLQPSYGDCAWTPWGSWGSCSADCGPRSRFRSRHKIEGSARGKPCEGSGSEKEDCSAVACPVTCGSVVQERALFYCDTGGATISGSTCTCVDPSLCAVNGQCIDMKEQQMLQLDKPVWDKDLALSAMDLAELSWMVYSANSVSELHQQLQDTQEYSLRQGWSGSRVVQALDESQAFMVVANEQLKSTAIVFRGTDDGTDAIMDIIADKWSGTSVVCEGQGEVHLGFYTIFTALLGDIIRSIKAVPDDHTLYLSGHSLGGALASLTSMLISRDDPQMLSRVRTVTFAAPRVVSHSCASQYNKKFNYHFAISKDGDRVPTLPPASWDYGDLGYSLTSWLTGAAWTVGIAPGVDWSSPLNHRMFRIRPDLPYLPTSLDGFRNTGFTTVVGEPSAFGRCLTANSHRQKEDCVCDDGHFSTGMTSEEFVCVPYPQGFQLTGW